MRRLISAVRTVVAYPSRWATTLTEQARDRADQRALWASIDTAVAKARWMARTDRDPLVQSLAEVLRMPTDVDRRQRKPQTRKEAA